MQTFTPKMVDLAKIDIDLINIEDIAHALSNICRYTGHTTEFYSVAQHSVISSLVCDEHPFISLMHDAAEAYVGDQSRPYKEVVTAGRLLESQWHRAVAQRFGYPYPFPPMVKLVDSIMLSTEHRDVMKPGYEWFHDKFPRLIDKIVPISNKEAEKLFLERFEALQNDQRDGIVTGIRDFGLRFSVSHLSPDSESSWRGDYGELQGR